jgi:hypothetical protein
MKLSTLFVLVFIFSSTAVTAASVRSDQIVSVDDWSKKEKKWGDTTSAVISEKPEATPASQTEVTGKQVIPAATNREADKSSSQSRVYHKSA